MPNEFEKGLPTDAGLPRKVEEILRGREGLEINMTHMESDAPDSRSVMKVNLSGPKDVVREAVDALEQAESLPTTEPTSLPEATYQKGGRWRQYMEPIGTEKKDRLTVFW